MKRPFANFCQAEGCPHLVWDEQESKRTPGNKVHIRVCRLANTPPTYLLVCPRKDKEDEDDRVH